MTIAAIILAAGSGTRAGGDLPKQWRDLGGMSVAARAYKAFATHPEIERAVLVVHPENPAKELVPDAAVQDVVIGSDTRAGSVLAGLSAIEGSFDHVLIHDGARPLVSRAVINRVIGALYHSAGAAPALSVTDALWRGDGGRVTSLQPRDGLFRAQTPQGFNLAQIIEAHRNTEATATDDVEVALAAGLDVAIVEGDVDNLKITTADDFERAARILETGMDIRTGTGFDVHRFTDGDQVTLCGVSVLHDRGLLGYSDADVGMHAITDAIYGAIAEGDIGRHFPPSDPQWKGADSTVFLDHAIKLARSGGYSLSNVDCTLICEHPKIGPHAQAMQLRLAEILNVDASRISVKATTSEQLGFTGRGEGIAAQAIATLVRK